MKGIWMSALLILFSCSIFIVFLPSIYAVGAAPINSSAIILYYKFNNNSSIGENSTLVVDYSGSANNGTLLNPVYNSTGGILGDGDLKFNGVNTSVTLKSNLVVYNSSVSMCAWTNLNATGNTQYLYSEYNGTAPAIELFVDTSSRYNFLMRNSTTTVTAQSGSVAANNTWTFICGSYDASTGLVKLYVNGTVASSPVGTVFGNFTSTNSRIGTRGNLNSWLNGTIDEFTIWNSTLSNSSIWSLYNSYLGCVSPYENMFIDFNTTLCSGNLTDTDTDGVIKIRAGGITLDCAGSYITGNNTYNSIGVIMSAAVNNVVIKSCSINNYSFGLRTTTSSYTSIFNNSFSGNTNISIDLRKLSNSSVYSNLVDNMSNISGTSGIGIANWGSGNSSNTTINNNVIKLTYNGINIGVGANNTIVENNTINNSYIYGILIDNDAYFETVRYNVIANTDWDGMQIRGANSNISYNNITNSGHHAVDFYTLTFIQNNIFENNLINGTRNNTINPYGYYMYLYRAQNNLIRNNRFFGGAAGLGGGVAVQGTTANPSINNTFYNNSFDNMSAFALAISNANQNTFYNNTWSNYNQNGTFALIAYEGNANNTYFKDANVDINQSSMTGYVDFNSTQNIISINNTGTTGGLIILNLTAQALFTTGSDICTSNLSDISRNTGIVSVYVEGNKTCYALQNYSVNQSRLRAFDPINVTYGSSNSILISSSLSSTVSNVSIAVLSSGIVPSNPNYAHTNGSTEVFSYIYDNNSGSFIFTSAIAYGINTLQLTPVVPGASSPINGGGGSVNSNAPAALNLSSAVDVISPLNRVLEQKYCPAEKTTSLSIDIRNPLNSQATYSFSQSGIACDAIGNVTVEGLQSRSVDLTHCICPADGSASSGVITIRDARTSSVLTSIDTHLTGSALAVYFKDPVYLVGGLIVIGLLVVIAGFVVAAAFG